RACPCPLCAPFVGKVFIDDVWSGADKSGISPVTGLQYPLLSEAIAAGLYHPRCRDVHTTYFEGVSTPPEGSEYTADELDEMAQRYESEQKQAYSEKQEERYDRMSKYTLDPDNQRMYGARAQVWGQKAESFGKLTSSMEDSEKKSAQTVEKSSESGIIDTKEVSKMSIHSIDMPIEQRNTGKGNPNAILMFGIELNKRQKRLLEMLSEFDSRVAVPKKSVSMADLSALTAYTGDEFALFTKAGERLIIRGNAKSVNIDVETAKQMAEQGYRWSGHTHPGIDYLAMQPSDGDYSILDCFNHQTTVIYNSKGNFRTFEKRS
ncbi:MAG: hypothetical protein IJ861_04130, partial [Clostridia bacterium]|nr:hypothetical protein [Clostridia bacterium]